MWNLWSREPKSLTQRARSPLAIIPMLCGQAIQLFPRPGGRCCTVHIWLALIRDCNLCNSEKPKYFFSYNFLRVFTSLGEGYLHVSITWYILYCISHCEQTLHLLPFKKKHVDLLLCYPVQFVSKWWYDTKLDIYSLIAQWLCLLKGQSTKKIRSHICFHVNWKSVDEQNHGEWCKYNCFTNLVSLLSGVLETW